jgi:hypothetical protein
MNASVFELSALRWILAAVIVITMDAARAHAAWTTAQLSVARYGLVATSIDKSAIFAGGFLKSQSAFWFARIGVGCIADARVYFFRCSGQCGLLPPNCSLLQAIHLMPLISSTVQRGLGRRLSSA